MNEAVSVLWLTFDGEEARYASLKPGEKYTQQTYDQHVWLIRGADDRKIMKYAAKGSPSDCVIKGGDDEGSGASDKCKCIEFNKVPANCGQTYDYKGKQTPWCYVSSKCAGYDGISTVDDKTPWKRCKSKS